MEAEDEYLETLTGYERTVAEKNRVLAEKDQALMQKDLELAKKDLVIEKECKSSRWAIQALLAAGMLSEDVRAPWGSIPIVRMRYITA